MTPDEAAKIVADINHLVDVAGPDLCALGETVDPATGLPPGWDEQIHAAGPEERGAAREALNARIREFDPPPQWMQSFLALLGS